MAFSRIGLMTSGGDAPGMNAAIRAVVRMGNHLGLDIVGVEDGYQGLLAGRVVAIEEHRLEGIERRGGTILGTSRSEEFRTPSGLDRGLEHLQSHNLEGLIVIGGEGSLRGAARLHERGYPVVVVPASIDNDVGGTIISIGVDTAINTALDAIDRLRDTASAFRRAFVVEVMGRDSGWIALQSAIASGAELVLVPEVPYQVEDVRARLRAARAMGKSHIILVAAEGISPPAAELMNLLGPKEEIGFELRLTILGHIQRGGSPTAFDRLLAARLGSKAAEELASGRHGTIIGLRGTETTATPIAEAIHAPSHFNPETHRFAEILAG